MPFIAIYTYLKNKTQALNLFKDIEKIEDEDLKNQRISTWIFLILLFLSISFLLVYASLTSVTETLVIQQPKLSVYTDLQSKYPDTLVCPCQQMLHPYNTFIISFAPKFNQICSSDFISQPWLNYVNYRSLTQIKYHYIFDFRHSAYSFFQMLHTLCASVSQTIDDQLIQFFSSTVLTENLLSEKTFLATILASKDQFLNTTASSFQTFLNSLRTIVQGNNLVNRLETNFLLEFIESTYTIISTTEPMLYSADSCSCKESSYCNITTGIYTALHRDDFGNIPDYYTFNIHFYKPSIRFDVPGINVGCLILDAVLQSDLSCLYNRSCLLQLNTYLNDSLSPFNATALTISNSPFPTVSSLVEKLMVDDWLFNVSYELYFSQCKPSICTYTYVKQFDILFIITTLMGAVGGIVTILMLVTLPLVAFTCRCVCRRRRSLFSLTEIDPEYDRSLRQHLQSLPSKIKDFIIVLNLFKDPEKASVHDLRNQRISTRLFIVLMIITLSVLVLYTSLVIVTHTVTIKQPTVNIYTELQTKYSETLVCPCTQIATDYEEFISFDSTLHQICSSDFITKRWMKYSDVVEGFLGKTNDLRVISSSYFATLLSFCNLSPVIINNALLVFNSTKYVTKNVQKTGLFRSQTEQIVNLFKQTTTNAYLQSLSMGREMVSGNALFSGLSTNYFLTYILKDSLNVVFTPSVYSSDGSGDSDTRCSCKLDPNTCAMPVAIYSNSISDPILLFSVPGFWAGCYIIESLFLSTLECYFNQSCLDQIYSLIASNSSYPFNATAMIYNSSNTQYQITTKMQDIIEHLMIEQWNNQISFTRYYEQCKPVFCIYTYNKQGDLVYMVTTIIDLIGGLTTVLTIPIPPIVASLRRKKRPQTIQREVDEHVHTPSFVHKLVQILKNGIIRLNLFQNPNKRSDEQVQHQRISTRIFIILFSVSFLVLLLYISLENVTEIVTVRNPSIDRFNKLYQQYPDTLRCPCKTLAIEYQNFIQFDLQFHAICNSNFVTSKTWLELDYPGWQFIRNSDHIFSTKVDDFRNIASPLFQLLSSFCQLSLQTLNTELLTFNFTTFITPNLVPQQQFDAQISQIIGQFIENTARSFTSALRLVNNMTSANMFISALSSDSVLTYDPQYDYEYYSEYYGYDRINEYIFDQKDQQYNSSQAGITCDCQKNSFCIQHAIVYDLDATTVLFPLPGIYVGCYIVEALLQSDLQ